MQSNADTEEEAMQLGHMSLGCMLRKSKASTFDLCILAMESFLTDHAAGLHHIYVNISYGYPLRHPRQSSVLPPF